MAGEKTEDPTAFLNITIVNNNNNNNKFFEYFYFFFMCVHRCLWKLENTLSLLELESQGP